MKSSGWKHLAPYPLDDRWDDVLALGPRDRCRAGTLANGMKFYVMRTFKPKDRASLALAVDVGSIAEEEDEQGVAHLVEHLAFRATESNENFHIVKFLESIGAEFGACQNAYTSMDETVYELTVPIDKPGILDEALSIMSEWVNKVRISDDDVRDERGAVLEEMRMGRDARGRSAEAYWKLLMSGSKYAERLPIGLQSVIKDGDPEVFRRFYRKWYRPERMAVVVVGDFQDLDGVAESIAKTFETCSPAPGQPVENPVVHRPTIAPHAAPRVTCDVDKEHTKTMVTVTYKYASGGISTPGGLFEKTVEEAFKLAIDNRLYKIMRKADPPFFSAACSVEDATRTTTMFSVQIVCDEGKVTRGLAAGLREMTRARLHGISEQELKIAAAKQLAEAEQLYVERDQTYCTSLRDELVGHFLRGELVVGAEEEARLSKACTEKMRTTHADAFGKKFSVDASCTIRVMEGRRSTTVEEIEAVVREIQREEDAGEITENAMFQVPSVVLKDEALPPPGRVTEERSFPSVGFEVLTLSNGMKVGMKTTDFLDDQVLVRCFAKGGLSEVPESEYLDALYANTIATELGIFGLKPEILSDVLAGKRCDVSSKTGTYYRRVDGDTSPTDIESGLQLIHALFTSNVRDMLVPEELEAVLRMQEQAIRNRSRNPNTLFHETIRYLAYGRSYMTRPLKPSDVRKMRPLRACEHFNASYSDPSEFAVALVGAFDADRVRPMLEKYLGSIPVPSDSKPHDSKPLTPATFKFPSGVVNKTIRVPMVEPMAMASIIFPINIPNPDHDAVTGEVVATVEGSAKIRRMKHISVTASGIIERRLLALLRFKFGEIYTCSAGASFSYQDQSAMVGDVIRGDVMISFSCDPDAGQRLAALALENVVDLIENGPTLEDVKTAVEVERRTLEVSAKENSYWREYFQALTNSRLAPVVDGDLDAIFELSERTREELLDGITPAIVREHLRECLKVQDRVVVVLRPRRALWRRVLTPDPTTAEGLVVMSCVGIAAWGVMRCFKRR